MHKLAIALSIGAAALFTTVDAKAFDNKASDNKTSDVATVAIAGTDATQPTDMSARRRYRRVVHYRGYRQRYAPSYGYYQQPYYQPAPAITFGFGGGGPRYYGGGGYGYGHRGW